MKTSILTCLRLAADVWRTWNWPRMFGVTSALLIGMLAWHLATAPPVLRASGVGRTNCWLGLENTALPVGAQPPRARAAP